MASYGASALHRSPGSVVKAPAMPRGQDILTVAKSQPETMRDATRGEFDPTNLECAIHSLVVSESLAHLTPLGWWLRADALYLERLKISPPLLAAFFHCDFGPRRLSLMHFKLCPQPEIDAWHNTLRSAPSSEGLPVPPTPSSIDDIHSAFIGLLMVVSRFGSEALQILVRSAEFAVSHLGRQFPDMVASDFPALVRFLDLHLRAFRVAIIADVVATPMTNEHAAVHKELQVGSSGLGRFISEMLLRRTFLLTKEMNQDQQVTEPPVTASTTRSKAKATKKKVAPMVRKRRPTIKLAKTPVKTPIKSAIKSPATSTTTSTKQQRGRIVVVVNNAPGQKRRGRGRRSTVSSS